MSQGDELRQWREGLDEALRTRKRRRGPVKVIAVGLVVLVIAGVVGAAAYWQVIEGIFKRQEVDLAQVEGGVLNVLLVGSDSREGLSDPEDVTRFGSVGGKRSDTIILAQFIPREQRGVLVHFPRDLFVTVKAPNREYPSKINSAYGDGPQAVVNTVAGITGVPINHYMEIDIRGFRAMVDAVGGIDITTDQNLYDSQLNFRLPAGANHLDGNQALSFVRARYATPDGDFGRIKRQQQFLRAVLDKVGKPSVLTNPARVNSLANAFARNVTVDQSFDLEDMIKLALSVRRTPSLQTFSVPGNSGRVPGFNGSYVVMDDAAAAPLFTALRNGDDPAAVMPAQQAAG